MRAPCGVGTEKVTSVTKSVTSCRQDDGGSGLHSPASSKKLKLGDTGCVSITSVKSVSSGDAPQISSGSNTNPLTAKDVNMGL